MNKASTKIDPKGCSFHSTAEFGRDYYRNHCGPTAITNLIITDRQRRLGKELSLEEAREIFETVASMGRHRLIYNRRYGTTDLLLWFYVKAAFKKLGTGTLRPAMRHTLSASNARRILSRGSFMLVELFGHPKYGWHQMVIYGTDENGLFITADGFSASPVLLNDKEIGRGLFLEIASREISSSV